MRGDNGNCLVYAKNDLDCDGPCVCYDCQDQLSDEAYAARVTRKAEVAKLRKYREGAYAFPPPPVPHDGWSEADWVRYIDMNGRWL